jgi:hypothetical protein
MNWKKVSLWSGVGGLLFGTAFYALKKSGAKPTLYADPIPKGVKRIFIELQPQVIDENGAQSSLQRCYVCEPTTFYIWNVLPSSRVAGRSGRGTVVSETQGTQIFFVVPTVRRWQNKDRELMAPGAVEEAFYATLRVHAEARRRSLVSKIAREFPLEFRKCLVGGGPNGIETGQVLVSPQPVLDYRFDMAT